MTVRESLPSADTVASGDAFQLTVLPLLSRSTVDREEALRDDEARLLELWGRGRVLVIDRTGRTPVRADGVTLADRPAADFGEQPPEDAVLLGEQDGLGYWAVRIREPDQDGPWLDLRGLGGLLDDTSAGLFTTAVALSHWHARARFCARCGSETRRVKAGWATQCPQCDREEYPRTDPAVICLVHDRDGVNGQRVLVARQPMWPQGRYSVLAGFVEAGESLEACVAREIKEEVGVEVAGIRYLGSQPWPFPRSLMIAFAATADPSAPLVLAEGEIEEALWLDRAEVRAAIAADDEGRDHPTGLAGPPSIARCMLESWANA